MKVKTYYYFVSYFNTSNGAFGFGSTEIQRESKITSIEDINSISELIKSNGNLKGVTVINFKLLKIE